VSRSLRATLRLDVRLQARSRLYVIGLFVAVLLGLALRALVPPEHVGRGLAAFYVLGLGGTTFMFGASMLLLERGEGTLAALRTTPLTPRDYVASKVLTLTGFALVESAVVFGLAARDLPPRPGLLVLGALVLGAVVLGADRKSVV
jgi:fluoroquinolone transport system permease protein